MTYNATDLERLEAQVFETAGIPVALRKQIGEVFAAYREAHLHAMKLEHRIDDLNDQIANKTYELARRETKAETVSTLTVHAAQWCATVAARPPIYRITMGPDYFGCKFCEHGGVGSERSVNHHAQCLYVSARTLTNRFREMGVLGGGAGCGTAIPDTRRAAPRQETNDE